MTENTEMRIVCYKTVNGQQVLANVATVTANPGLLIKTIVGVGNPYWAWPTFTSPGPLIAADFTNAPICSSVIAENTAAYENIIANGPEPEDVLTWGTP